MRRIRLRAVLFGAAVAISGLVAGCDSGKVELAKEAPKVDVPPPPANVKQPGGDKKETRPAGGSGGVNINTYGSK